MIFLILLPLAVTSWTVPLELAIGAANFHDFGSISIDSDSEGNFTGFFKSSLNPSQLQKSLHQNLAGQYKIKGGSVSSSSSACLMLKSGLKHEFHLTIDGLKQKILSLTVFPQGLYDVGELHCDETDIKHNFPSKLQGSVIITCVKDLPSPDVTTYLQRMEDEKRARQHGAAQDNRSFLAKYWMYIVPAVIFLLITNAVGTDQQAEG
ncbi:unnamed protein product [Bursaphelenchus xylophilus]|uniref:ER membrane protein complex subunit 10 n=1 Tax=Bursaphelenchus xylophilus TaxID=6326 RepID=A0A1I7SD66_BURXY|nr:unnamed protein product [Bursaphelenchus xylophilus]CAG9130518.1 unnamed protein product [Bursaphelenchus xylophilus]